MISVKGVLTFLFAICPATILATTITSGSLVYRSNGDDLTCADPQNTRGYALGECSPSGSRSYIYTNCTTNPDDTISYKKIRYDTTNCSGPVTDIYSYTESSVCDDGSYYYCSSSMAAWLDIDGMNEHSEYYNSQDCTGPYYLWYGYIDTCSSSGSCSTSGDGTRKTICDRIPTASPTPQPSPAPTTPGATNAPTAVDVSVGYDVIKSAGGSLLNNDYSSLTVLEMGDDDVIMLKLPFAFNFYGKYYEYGYLGGNGLLSFENGCDADFNDCSSDIDVTSASALSTSSLSARTKDINKVPLRESRALSVDDVTASYIVVLKRKVTRAHIDELLLLLSDLNDTQFAVDVDEVMYGLRMIVIRRPSSEALDFLRMHKHVQAVRSEKVVSVTEIPNARRRVTASDTYSWGLDRIDQVDLPLDNKAYKPSSASGGGKGVSVFVLDTGIDTNHIEFTTDSSREVKNVYNYYGEVTADTDGEGHGSHCAGTVGGTNVGVAPKANIYGVKVLNDEGRGSNTGVVSGLEYVYNYRLANPKTPMVVSMSLGGDCNPADDCSQDPEIIALEELSAVDVSVVVAAGNEAEDACTKSPAMAPTAITVGATDINDEQAMYSNNGECVDIQAPGHDIVSVCASSQCDGLENEYVENSGTSMACPHVAGIVALWLSQTASSYRDPPSTSEIRTAIQCLGIPNTLDEVRSDTLNMFVQVPDPSFDNFKEAQCDTEGQCGTSDGEVCSNRGTCEYGMCVCEDSYTGNCCENDGPNYEVHIHYCCEGGDLSDSDVVGPFNALAFMWVDFHAEIDDANVYFGAVDVDTTAIVFENVPAFDFSCRATIEVLLHRDGDIQVAIVSNNIATGEAPCDAGEATMGLKGPRPEDGADQLYEDVYGPSDDDMPTQEIITYRPLYVVRPPSNTTVTPGTCSAPVPTKQQSNNNDDDAEVGAAVIITVPIVGVLLLLASAAGVFYYRRNRSEKYDDDAVKAREKIGTGNPLQLA